MKRFISLFIKFLADVNDKRDMWTQSKIEKYVNGFHKRMKNNNAFWIEKATHKSILTLKGKGMLTLPNIISLFRAFLSFPLFMSIIDNHYKTAFVIFIIALILDAIDGPLARWLNQESDLGAFFDALGDKLIFAAVFLTLGYKYLSHWLFFTSLTFEIIMVFMSLVLRQIAEKIGLKVEKKSVPAGKIKFLFQSIGLGLIFVSCLTEIQAINMANIFFIISLPFAIISIVAYFVLIHKENNDQLI